jgi:hypothetical protein
MGNYVGFSWAALVYPPLRYIELHYMGRWWGDNVIPEGSFKSIRKVWPHIYALYIGCYLRISAYLPSWWYSVHTKVMLIIDLIATYVLEWNEWAWNDRNAFYNNRALGHGISYLFAVMSISCGNVVEFLNKNTAFQFIYKQKNHLPKIENVYQK